MGRKSLYALILRAPLCGANNHIYKYILCHVPGKKRWKSERGNLDMKRELTRFLIIAKKRLQYFFDNFQESREKLQEQIKALQMKLEEQR